MWRIFQDWFQGGWIQHSGVARFGSGCRSLVDFCGNAWEKTALRRQGSSERIECMHTASLSKSSLARNSATAITSLNHHSQSQSPTTSEAKTTDPPIYFLPSTKPTQPTGTTAFLSKNPTILASISTCPSFHPPPSPTSPQSPRPHLPADPRPPRQKSRLARFDARPGRGVGGKKLQRSDLLRRECGRALYVGLLLGLALFAPRSIWILLPGGTLLLVCWFCAG